MKKVILIGVGFFAAAIALVMTILIVIVMGTDTLNTMQAHMSAQCDTQVTAAPANVTVTAASLHPSQRHYAAIIVGVAKNRGLGVRGAEIGLSTALVETVLSNPLTATDHDSVGLFQQRPSQGWGTPQELTNPVTATNKFFNAMIKNVPNWKTMQIGTVAQAVQHSAFPDRYQAQAPLATTIATQAFGQVSGSAVALTSNITGCSGPQSATTVAMTGASGKVVHSALTQLGLPYVFGGNIPKGLPGAGLDCSGLTQWSYKQIGVQIPRVANDQYNAAKLKFKPTVKNLQPGDLLFENFDEPGQGPGWGHVGMYIGVYKGVPSVVEEPHTGDVAKVVSFAAFNPPAAGRYLVQKH